MKFSCDQQELNKALNIVSKAVTSRTTTPILKGILIDVKEDGTLTMSASDLDISITDTIQADVQEAGSVIVMAKLFVDIIRKLPRSAITIESDDDYNVTIRSMKSEFHVVGMSPDEFPELNKEDASAEFVEFDKNRMKSMIEKTSFAASVDESRGIITGVLMEIEPEELNMVAIDGYRMAINRSLMPTGQQRNIVVSARILSDISRILSDVSDDENGKMYISSRKVIFHFDHIKAELKIMEGEFIRYRDILPKESKIEMIINRAELLEGIERASLLSKAGKNNLIRMHIQDDRVTITSTSEEGNVREEISVSKNGEDLIIGFNAQYLMDVLKKVDDEEIRMLFNSQITPCLIRPMEGRDYEYIVLPVRIS